MIGKFAGAAIALLASVTLAFAGDPVGSYGVAGANPGNPDSQYSGTVSVQKTGDTYLVIWSIGSQTFTGTGDRQGQRLLGDVPLRRPDRARGVQRNRRQLGRHLDVHRQPPCRHRSLDPQIAAWP